MNFSVPTQDEFDAWRLHPVTQFVAEAYRLKAEVQKAEWLRYFDARIIPAEIGMKKLELQTREDAYRAFLETTLDDYIAIVAPPEVQKPRTPARSSRA